MNNKVVIKRRSDCRVCKGINLEKVLSFGLTPLANAFLTKENLDRAEAFYPLDLYFCKDCSMLQLGHVVSPKLLFSNYVYVSSTSPVFINHFKEFANSVVKRFHLNENSLVIDIGSNDGILLKPFLKQGVKVLGIEPAKHIAQIAQKEGVETIPQFFSKPLSKKMALKYGKAKVITATNVFAHIDDLDEVINGVNNMLDDNGVFMIEAPYLIDFIEKKYFDLVYHEHLSYWSVASLKKLFERFNMSIFDVEKVPSHGGSIRIFVKKNNGEHKVEKSVREFLNLEKKMKLNKIQTYILYGNEVLANKAKITTLLAKLVLKNKKIIGFGAPAKGNTLLNYFKIGPEILSYIIDDSPFKQGLYTPGTHIPVISPENINNIDYMFILAWNFAKPIIQRYSFLSKKGVKFIIPAPNPQIV
ncbi:class I SAM-dependent methyltransferase [Candidatus Microgenomates bacterium]|nr:MAG: class I SAM-dependent methyltransferase [Candidatus Microgenomates bacterium]